MIWRASVIDGVYTAGFYRVNRRIHGYEAWFTAPKAMRLIGKTDYLHDAKDLCSKDAKEFPVKP
jgi:hypothetical protein